MPSSPSYKRNHTQELKTQKARGDDIKKRKRMKDLRAAKKAGKAVGKGSGNELDHTKGVFGGKTRVISKAKNRSLGGKGTAKSSVGKASGARIGHASRKRKSITKRK